MFRRHTRNLARSYSPAVGPSVVFLTVSQCYEINLRFPTLSEVRAEKPRA